MEEWWMEENGNRLEVIKSLLLRVLDSQPSNHPHLAFRQTRSGQVLMDENWFYLLPLWYSFDPIPLDKQSTFPHSRFTWARLGAAHTTIGRPSWDLCKPCKIQCRRLPFDRNAASSSTVPPTRKHLAIAHTHSHTHAIRNEIRKYIYKKTNRRRKGKK